MLALKLQAADPNPACLFLAWNIVALSCCKAVLCSKKRELLHLEQNFEQVMYSEPTNSIYATEQRRQAQTYALS